MSHQILIVDDDTDFREELSDFLNYYRVLEAPSGDEALKLIRKSNMIDLVILDVVMPGTDGIEVLKEMKKKIPDLSVIILTGKSSKDVVVEALRGHADDYFEKPINLNRLDDSIKKILNGKEKNLVSVTSGKNYKIERAKKFVERNTNNTLNLKDVAMEVCLSPKYFSRLFKEDVGVGFNEYKFKIRTERSQNLLKRMEYTIHQIAEEFGYKNLESFTRFFKKTTGITPAIYRRNYNQKLRMKNEKMV